MRTLDAQVIPNSRLARLSRDAKLLFRLASMLLSYLSYGGMIRRRYRERARHGETYWLDEP